MDTSEKSRIIYENNLKSKDHFVTIYSRALNEYLGNKDNMHIVDWAAEASSFSDAFWATIYSLWEE